MDLRNKSIANRRNGDEPKIKSELCQFTGLLNTGSETLLKITYCYLKLYAPKSPNSSYFLNLHRTACVSSYKQFETNTYTCFKPNTHVTFPTPNVGPRKGTHHL